MATVPPSPSSKSNAVPVGVIDDGNPVPAHQEPINELFLQELQKKTKCTPEEIREILSGFNFQEKGALSKEEFTKFLDPILSDGSKDSLIIDRLFDVFDQDKNEKIDFAEFSIALSVLTGKSHQHQLDFIFHVFDLNGDGRISPEEFTTIVTNLWQNKICQSLIHFAIDEKRITGIEVFVEEFFSRADKNKDGYISFEEFIDIAGDYVTVQYKLKILPHQTGGHTGTFQKLSGGKIMKAVSVGEFTFYGNLYKSTVEWPLKAFLPSFFGTETKHGKSWIIIEDLCHGFSFPCVMDIKMGLTSAGEDATPEKREQMLKKDVKSTTSSLGLRITGMKVYQVTNGEYLQYTKSWGRKVTDDGIEDALLKFFSNGQNVRMDAIDVFLYQLKIFQRLMESQSNYRFYSSSLLFVYDGKPEPATDVVSKVTLGAHIDLPVLHQQYMLKMIDFAHVFPIPQQQGKDDGYIFGINNLVK
eukprot:CAMPEP_0168556132 /NCGR_PEP_ID=MMETSP0413-20121227/8713_1 /TAXON_ID=136452 /ORGANISM="Filamoeba nolandi, Strain NC-AS-23-1" /LENGTH=470 /DNA_ID=CAMNT_0008587045 /DNA_START=8 /DNA_END=1416 /DNA_ORIENTATION=-